MKIAATLIVKNEHHVIARCLTSLLPVIDAIVVADTGSRDSTREVIKDFAASHALPLILADIPWKGFADARNGALTLARTDPHLDWGLMIDADEIIVPEPDFDGAAFRANLDKNFPFYHVESRMNATYWNRPQLINLHGGAYWRGAVHEFLEADNRLGGNVTEFWNRPIQDSARNLTPGKFANDANLIIAALETERDPMMRSRYTFYTGQCWRDAGEYEKAAAWYARRVALASGWNEERYVAAWQAGRCLAEVHGHKCKAVLQHFANANTINPARLEAIHEAMVYCRKMGFWDVAWQWYTAGLAVLAEGQPQHTLFPEPWRYRYGLYDEAAVISYHRGDYATSATLCRNIIGMDDVPTETVERTRANLDHALARLTTPAKS